MAFHDLLADLQGRCRGRHIPRRVQPLKNTENPLEVFRRDADAIVLTANAFVGRRRVSPTRGSLALLAVKLDCVHQQSGKAVRVEWRRRPLRQGIAT